MPPSIVLLRSSFFQQNPDEEHMCYKDTTKNYEGMLDSVEK